MKNPLDFSTEQKTWDDIATSFDSTRTHPWPLCMDFIDSIEQSKISVDLGCGNGRHLIPLSKKSKQAIGIDLSKKLLTITKQKLTTHAIMNTTLVQASNTHIPLPSQSVDTILYVASLHNIKTKQMRILSLKEIKRILKPSGNGLISVWAQNQPRFKEQLNRQNLDEKTEPGDIILYWRQHNLNIPRFYHLYTKEELILDLETSDLHIKDIIEASLTKTPHVDNYFALVTNK